MSKDSEVKKKNVYEAIALVQSGLAKSGISKDKTAKGGGDSTYKFRGIDDIYNALASLLAEHGLCIIPRILSREITERKSAKGNALFYVVVDVEYDFVSSTDGSKHTARVCGEAMDSGDKATNKAMSAAYKYVCLQTFCIPTEGDNDADATTHEVAAKDVIFASQEARDLYVKNCIEALGRAPSLVDVKDQKDLNSAKWDAMKLAGGDDLDAFNKIAEAYNAAVLKYKPKATVESAKLPPSVANDTIPY